MKQYALFQYLGYYPSGGWNDFMGTFDSPEDALTYVNSPKNKYPEDYYQVVDLNNGEVVHFGELTMEQLT